MWKWRNFALHFAFYLKWISRFFSNFSGDWIWQYCQKIIWSWRLLYWDCKWNLHSVEITEFYSQWKNEYFPLHEIFVKKFESQSSETLIWRNFWEKNVAVKFFNFQCDLSTLLLSCLFTILLFFAVQRWKNHFSGVEFDPRFGSNEFKKTLWYSIVSIKQCGIHENLLSQKKIFREINCQWHLNAKMWQDRRFALDSKMNCTIWTRFVCHFQNGASLFCTTKIGKVVVFFWFHSRIWGHKSLTNNIVGIDFTEYLLKDCESKISSKLCTVEKREFYFLLKNLSGAIRMTFATWAKPSTKMSSSPSSS